MGATVLVSGEADRQVLTAPGVPRRPRRGDGQGAGRACEDLLTPATGAVPDMARDASLAGLAGDDRDAFLDALLAEMSFTQRPAVVIVEDAHWADAASLDIIRLPGQADRPAGGAAGGQLPRRGAGDITCSPAWSPPWPGRRCRIELEGLSDEAVAELATAAGLDSCPVVAAVGGNPFYLTEVLAALGAAVPPSVRHAVRARFRRCRMSCRSSLERLAVVPQRGRALAGAVPGRGPDGPGAGRAARMLVAAQGRVRFRHELARRAVELSLPSTRRMDHHRRVLVALAVGGAEPSRLVHHAVAAADEQAVAHNAAAAAWDAAGSSAHREAAAFARLALEHEDRFDRFSRWPGWPGWPPGPCTPETSSGGGRARRPGGRALDASGSAPQELGEALVVSARIYRLADPEAARAKAAGPRHPGGLGPSRALALCYSTLGSQDTLQARFDTAIGWSKRALDLAERIGSPEVVSHALGYRGVARASLGDEAGLADLEQAVETVDRLGHGDYLNVAAHNLAVVLIRSGRLREAKDYLDIGERAAREYGLDTGRFRIEAQQCHVLLLQGAWDEAERRLRRLLEQADDPGANLVNPLAFLGRILARRGDLEAAALIDRSWRLASATGEDQKMAIAAGARIERLWLEGDETGCGPTAPSCSRSPSAPSTATRAARCCATCAGSASRSSRSTAACPPSPPGSTATGRPRPRAGSGSATPTTRRWS